MSQFGSKCVITNLKGKLKCSTSDRSFIALNDSNALIGHFPFLSLSLLPENSVGHPRQLQLLNELGLCSNLCLPPPLGTCCLCQMPTFNTALFESFKMCLAFSLSPERLTGRCLLQMNAISLSAPFPVSLCLPWQALLRKSPSAPLDIAVCQLERPTALHWGLV